MLSPAEKQRINLFVQSVAENGRWNSHSGDIILDIIPFLPGWPENRQIIVVNERGERQTLLANQDGYHKPILLQLVKLPAQHHAEMKLNHYNAIVNGQVEQINPDGNCMFNALFSAMGENDAREFKRAMRRNLDPIHPDLTDSQLFRRTLANEVVTNPYLAERIAPFLVEEPVTSTTNQRIVEQHELAAKPSPSLAVERLAVTTMKKLSKITYQLNSPDKHHSKGAIQSLDAISSALCRCDYELPNAVFEKQLEVLMIAATQQSRSTEVINMLADSNSFLGKKIPGLYRTIMKRNDPVLLSNLDGLVDAAMNGKLTKDTWQKASRLKEKLKANDTRNSPQKEQSKPEEINLRAQAKKPNRSHDKLITTPIERLQPSPKFRHDVDKITRRGLFSFSSMRISNDQRNSVKEKPTPKPITPYRRFK